MASSWILFFSYQDDALSNTHQIFLAKVPVCSSLTQGVQTVHEFTTRVRFLEHPVYLASFHMSVNTSKIVVADDVMAMVIWVYFMFDRSINHFRRLSRAGAGFIDFQNYKL